MDPFGRFLYVWVISFVSSGDNHELPVCVIMCFPGVGEYSFFTGEYLGTAPALKLGTAFLVKGFSMSA